MGGFLLDRLQLEDFLDGGTKVFAFGGRDGVLRGGHGTGKTAVKDGFGWLLLQPCNRRWSAVEAQLRCRGERITLRRDHGFWVDGERCTERQYRRQLERLGPLWKVQVLLSWDSLLQLPWLWSRVLEELWLPSSDLVRQQLEQTLEADVAAGGKDTDHKARIRALRRQQAQASAGRIFTGFCFHRKLWGWEVSRDGIPWEDMSPACAMRTGLTLRRMLCRVWDLTVPLFLDDSHLLLELPDPGSQCIALVAAPGELTWKKGGMNYE